ncbi:RNA-guided endonuclease TnpB family protein [Sporolactobacillus terrae]|uniref:Transposase n=1 Tax=Sporolactobacillus terrae TaxID=269673 RepID=A0ABX5Q557_9BACL|nr:RNA-guided endonuclease TnpB family protein [Sporolactobacillus terrae]QAA21771.1 transposase [Sporolactobacillus terrae]QAA24744.1 transposase [Sporolactobacillus terrae]UAK16573.1 transposase [Sporolactobacillus terrae]
MTMKTFKLRLYPNAKQRQQIESNFGACRFVWNELLNMQIQRHDNGGKYINEFGMNYLIKPLKKQYPWLKEADATSLLAVSHNLHLAFQKLFKEHAGYPKFKAKRFARPAYRSNAVNGNIVLIDNKHFRLPKLGQISCRAGQLPDGKVKTATVVRSRIGKYYVLVTADIEIAQWSKTSASVGIDVGIADLVITSDGTRYGTKRFDKALSRKKHYWEKRLARRRRQAEKEMAWDKHFKVAVPRQLTDFKNYMKAKMMVAKYSEKVANQRRDYLQKISAKLIRHYDVIKLEDLKTKGLMRNHNLARAIANQSWRELRLMLEYKATWYGKQVVAVSPYKTSQRCSLCGYDDGKHELDVREWTCPQCHAYHDRDINAAKNILAA